MPDLIANGARKSQPRGAAGRVAQAHHQARRSLGVAVAFALASPLAWLAPHETGTWLPLHLFLVGTLLAAISGATQMLAVTWSSAPAPAPVLATAQRGVLAAGVIGVAAGRETGIDALTAAGGVAVASGLVLLAAILVGIRRTTVTDRYQPAIDVYLTALAFGAVGVFLGVALGTGAVTERWASVRDAHLTINVFGLVGLVIVGTLPYFVATQARTKMSPAATPARVRGAGAAAAAATATAAAGHLLEAPLIAALGLGAYVVALGATATLLPRLRRRQLDWAGPRLVQLAAGLAWWVGTTAVLAVKVASQDHDQSAVLRALAIGGFAQVVASALAYLGPVVRGGGHQRLHAGFALTGSWLSVAAANVAAAAALADQSRLLGVALGVWAVDAAQRTVRLTASRAGGGRPPTSARPTTADPTPR